MIFAALPPRADLPYHPQSGVTPSSCLFHLSQWLRRPPWRIDRTVMAVAKASSAGRFMSTRSGGGFAERSFLLSNPFSPDSVGIVACGSRWNNNSYGEQT